MDDDLKKRWKWKTSSIFLWKTRMMTSQKMEDDLKNKIKNGRRPQKKKNGRWPPPKKNGRQPQNKNVRQPQKNGRRPQQKMEDDLKKQTDLKKKLDGRHLKKKRKNMENDHKYN